MRELTGLRRGLVLSIATVAAAAAGWACPAAAQTATETAAENASGVSRSVDVLPPGVLLHAGFPSVDAFRERIRDARIYGLLTDPSMEDFKSQLMEKIEQASDALQKETGLTLEDLVDMAQGEVAFALMQPPGESMAVALFVDYGQNQATVDAILEQLEDAAKDNGGEILSEPVDGAELITVIMDENPGVDPEIASYNYMLRDDVWVMASSLDALAAINDRWDGGSEPTFAQDDATYKEVTEAIDLGTGRAPSTTFFANPIGIVRAGVQAFAQADPNNGQQAMMAMGFLPLTGLDNFRAVASAADFDPETGDEISKSFLRINRSGNAGLLDLFALAAADNTPPAFVSADVNAFQSLQWQPEKAYKAVESLVDQFTGPGTVRKQLEQIEEMPDGPGINPKTDVLDQITGRLVVQADTAGRGDQAQERQLISLELVKGSTLPDTVKRLVDDMGGDNVDQRDFRGTTVYQFEFPAQSVGAEPGQMQTGGLAFADGYLHFATQVSLLEAVLRGVENPLSEAERFTSKVGDVPKATLYLQFSDGAAQIEQAWEFARNGGLDEALDDEDFDFDFTTLPPFNEVRKYLGTGIGYAIRTDDGVLTTGRKFAAE